VKEGVVRFRKVGHHHVPTIPDVGGKRPVRRKKKTKKKKNSKKKKKQKEKNNPKKKKKKNQNMPSHFYI